MTAIITQARVNSTRLPNKIFKEAGGLSYMEHHINRLNKTGLPVIVATTNNGSEKPILDFCKQKNISVFCGDENDVLKRYYDCAKQFGVSTVIRVTSDCPLIDAAIILKGLEVYKSRPANTYYSNTLQRSYPRGMDYELFSFGLLEEAFKHATEESDREHVTPYIWKNRSGSINLEQDITKPDSSRFRITLDTKEDQELLTRLIEEYHADRLNCSQIVRLLQQHPQLAAINNRIEQKKV